MISTLSSTTSRSRIRQPRREFYRAIVESARRLTDFPNMGHAGRCPGTFEYSVTSLPYVIAYQVEADLVTVLAVFHAARNLAREIVERRSKS